MQIFDLYSAQLYRFALHLCGDPVTADHVVGDTFAKLLEQFSVGKGPDSNLRAYLYQMVHHLVIDEARYLSHRLPLFFGLIAGIRLAGHLSAKAGGQSQRR